MRYFKYFGFAISLLVLCSVNLYAEKELSSELNIYNWEDYFAPTTLRDFQRAFGVKVHLTTFSDEEEMVSELQADTSRYDIIITSDDTIRELSMMRLLAEIDIKNIPNLKNIESRFRNPEYDRGHRYSIPYMLGTTGLIVNRSFIKEETDSWSILWNPEYKGKIAMLNNLDEVIGAVLKLLGYSINTTDPNELEEARQKLLEQKPLLAGYLDVIEIRDRLIAGEIWVAQIYSGEGMYAVDKNSNLEYIIPKEGCALWIDNLAIPRDSPHKYTAEVFMNYILDPKASAKIANYLWYANTNLAAKPFTLKEIIKHPSVYPTRDSLKKCEYFKSYVGDPVGQRKSGEIRNRIWSELQLKNE